jgi:hypothetical protein
LSVREKADSGQGLGLAQHIGRAREHSSYALGDPRRDPVLAPPVGRLAVHEVKTRAGLPGQGVGLQRIAAGADHDRAIGLGRDIVAEDQPDGPFEATVDAGGQDGLGTGRDVRDGLPEARGGGGGDHHG